LTAPALKHEPKPETLLCEFSRFKEHLKHKDAYACGQLPAVTSAIVQQHSLPPDFQ
jgi:hypothetical protein